MKVRALTEVPTAKGMIQVGQIIEIPESLMAKLKGKVAEITPMVDDRLSSHTSKPDLTPAVIVDPIAPVRALWSLEMQSLVVWFMMQEAPVEPFYLEPHQRVLDPVKFFLSLRQDIAKGPAGARAKYGTLQDDLRKLKNFLN